MAFRGHTTITAQAVIPEGMALEAWVRDDVDWKPTPTPVPTPEPTEEPAMYSVSCMDCSFDGKTSAISVTINQDTFIRYIQDIN